MRIAIDLIWVKVKKNGGIESYIRNLLDGITDVDSENKYVLITAQDNADSFRHYIKKKNFYLVVAPVASEPVWKRLIWQNLEFENFLLKRNLHNCFCPVYLKPFFFKNRITYVSTIHDLQQLHYPQYFSKLRYLWVVFGWRRTVRTSKKIIAISNYVRKDIIKSFHASPEKVKTIYNPIIVDNGELPFEEVSKKYEIEDNNYYFALSAFLKHKNLDTLIELIKRIQEKGLNDIPNKIIISGVNGEAKEIVRERIEKYDLQNNCILTDFISNEERNTLYKHSFAFLFPSIFEGFGMPVVEGLMLGTRVITTKKTSIPEVSKHLAIYVDDPFDVDEWIDKIYQAKKAEKKRYIFPGYNKDYVARRYIKVFEQIFK